jgi:type I restriction enzyme S subunit
MLRLGKTTSGLNTISTNNVRSVQVFLPPVHLQEQFENVVRRVRSLANRMQLDRYDEHLFLSLMYRAFGRSQPYPEVAC